MSHIPLRKEKDCLNCGAEVQGRYCQDCGQENVVPHETFWHMVKHFFYDITHFDSKFFETVKDLLFKPGFLTRQYVQGKRVAYLHPIKMYVFTSAVFFLIFFSFFQPKANMTDMNVKIDSTDRAEYIREIRKDLQKDSANPVFKEELSRALDTAYPITLKDYYARGRGSRIQIFGDTKFPNAEAYDSAQKSLPPDQRDGWFRRRLIKKQFAIDDEFRKDPDGFSNKLLNSIVHRMPYMLFLSLPLFALLLKLVYLRRKQFYYADHGIFTIHLYVFTFIMLLVVLTFGRLRDLWGWNFLNWIIGLLVILLFFYLYKGMRNFYGQGRAKTFLKYLFVVFISLIMMLVLFALFTFFSAFTF